MRIILHISDIHFGRTDPSVIDALELMPKQLQPDLIVISGDITQRSLVREYKEAEAFVKRLALGMCPVVAVPGNHDLGAWYQPVRRLHEPLKRYETYIVPHTLDTFVDAEIAVYGITTARAHMLKSGHISAGDIEKAEEWFSQKPEGVVRMIALHHPLDLPAAFAKRKKKLVKNAAAGMRAFSKARIDAFLSGHYHKSATVSTSVRYTSEQYGAVAIQAGTVSTRGRGEVPSFNVIRVEQAKMDITPYLYDPSTKTFCAGSAATFIFTRTGWSLAAAH